VLKTVDKEISLEEKNERRNKNLSIQNQILSI